MSSTHRKSAARALAARLGIGYQQALNIVTETANETVNRRPSSRTAETPPEARPYVASTGSPHAFNLGTGPDGSVVVWDTETHGSLLVTGNTGDGTTIVADALLRHTADEPSWQVLCTDDLSGLSSTVEALVEIEQQMYNRYDQMADQVVNHYTQLSDRPNPVLVLIDVPALSAGQTDPDTWLRFQIVLGSLVRLGKAVGIHVCLLTKYPAGQPVVSTTVDPSFAARLALGKVPDADRDTYKWAVGFAAGMGRGAYLAGQGDPVAFTCFAN